MDFGKKNFDFGKKLDYEKKLHRQTKSFHEFDAGRTDCKKKCINDPQCLGTPYDSFIDGKMKFQGIIGKKKSTQRPIKH